MGFFLSSEERARRRKARKDIQAKAQTLTATTADLHADYTIMDITKAESLQALKEKAVKMGADALIGIGFFGYDEQCYGTVVKLIPGEEQEKVEELKEGPVEAMENQADEPERENSDIVSEESPPNNDQKVQD